jgi:hypothetical protein
MATREQIELPVENLPESVKRHINA